MPSMSGVFSAGSARARSAMDGYAVRGEDTFGASAYDPITLEVRGEALPGRPFEGRVGKG